MDLSVFVHTRTYLFIENAYNLGSQNHRPHNISWNLSYGKLVPERKALNSADSWRCCSCVYLSPAR